MSSLMKKKQRVMLFGSLFFVFTTFVDGLLNILPSVFMSLSNSTNFAQCYTIKAYPQQQVSLVSQQNGLMWIHQQGAYGCLYSFVFPLRITLLVVFLFFYFIHFVSIWE